MEHSEVERICLKYGEYIRRICYGIVGPREVEDAVQEVFLKLLRTNGKYDPRKSKEETWVRRVARNVAISYNRSRLNVRENEIKGDDIPGFVPVYRGISPREKTQFDQLSDLILSGIRGLKPEQRACVERFHLDGEEISKIAEEMGTSISMVKFHLIRGRDKLSKSLGGML